MKLVTIKEFAESQLVSYEAIRKQLQVYRDDLAGHIIKKGRTQYLDEFAVNFLTEKRKDNPIIDSKRNYQMEIDELQKQVDSLKTLLLQAQQQVINLQEDQKQLTEENTKNKLLLEVREGDRQRLQEQNDSLRGELTDIKTELKTAEAELNSFSRSWFGFYRKK